MDNFLKNISKKIASLSNNNDCSKITVITPSKRASHFINEYLLQELNHNVIIAPKYTNLIKLFASKSSLSVMDDPIKKIELVALLFNSFSKYYNSDSSCENKFNDFNTFFHFGKILLNDFIDVDYYLSDDEVKSLFTNIDEYKQLTDSSFLTQEQIEIIWRTFGVVVNSSQKSELKAQFSNIWNILYNVYTDFVNNLKSRNIGYESLLLKELTKVSDEELLSKFDQNYYIVAGYHLLTKVEKTLLLKLKKSNKFIFFWDYSDTYFKDESSRFIKLNISEFGNSFESEENNETKNISIWETPTISGQAGIVNSWCEKYKSQILNEIDSYACPSSAIVLGDESLLPLLTAAIPDQQIKNSNFKYNIAILNNLIDFQIATLIFLLIDLQAKSYNQEFFYCEFLLPVLRHPLINSIFPDAEIIDNNIKNNKIRTVSIKELQKFDTTLFNPIDNKNPWSLLMYLQNIVEEFIAVFNEKENNSELISLNLETMVLTRDIINKLLELINKKIVDVNISSVCSLLKQLLKSQKIPFHSKDELLGLQILGIPDVRTIDFNNLLILSCNEGIVPPRDFKVSFIPQMFRYAFNMNTIEHQDSDFAYQFYRVLQRAKNITLVYCSGNETTGSGEKSRFISQIIAENKYIGANIDFSSIEPTIKINKSNKIIIQKSDEIINCLKNKYSNKALSPSVINTFIDCSLRFFFQYVLNVREPNSANELNFALLGSIFHKTMERIYYNNNKISSTLINSITEAAVIEHIVDSFDELYFKNKTELKSYNGTELIYFNVVKELVKTTLEIDKKYAAEENFEIISQEEEYIKIFNINGFDIKVGGRIDRIDKKNDIVRIVDYKTSSVAKSLVLSSKDSIEDILRSKIFDGSKSERLSYHFQAFFYCWIMIDMYSNIMPVLYYPLIAKKEGIDQYNPNLLKENTDFSSKIEKDFVNLLKETLQNMFDKEIPFEETTNENNCNYCAFINICGKKRDNFDF